MKKRLHYIFFLLLFILSLTFAEPTLKHGGIGLEYGIWKPNTLDENPSHPLKNVDGADYYYGISLVTPSLNSYALRLTYLEWEQQTPEALGIESVLLQHVSIDLQNILIKDSRISPAVNYGVTAFWAEENLSNNNSNEPTHMGYGVNFGAELKIQLLQHAALSAEYQYLYAIFEEKVGLSENYSGPKISVKLYYLF